MSVIFDEEKGYLTDVAKEVINTLTPQMEEFAKTVISSLQMHQIPPAEWNLFLLYYKETMYTEVLVASAQRRIQFEMQSKVSSDK